MNLKTGVLTSYTVNGRCYASYILGNDLEEIERAAKRRGLNEEIVSALMEVETIPHYLDLNDYEFIRRMPEILHTSCFLSFITLKANTMTAEELLGDEGIIHEMSHVIADINGCHKKSLTCIRDFLKRLQRSAIGLYEPV